MEVNVEWVLKTIKTSDKDKIEVFDRKEEAQTIS